MRLARSRYFVILATIIILLLSACNQGPETPAPTVDTAEIAAVVLAQVENQLADQNEVTSDEIATAVAEAAAAAAADTTEAVTEDVLASVLDLVDARLAEAEEPTPMPVSFSSEAVQLASAGLETALVDLYQKTNPAVVYILVPPVSSGSGFVFSEEGYIVTNNHVVDGGRSFEVVFANGERRRAELVGTDVDSDLAVIQVDSLPDGVAPLPLGSSADLSVGQLVVAIGNPFGEQGSMSLGIISGLNRSLSSQRGRATGDAYSLPQVIQTDAPINPGNSGGPLLNLNGQVVGVNSAIASSSGTNSGVGFSVPVDAVARVAPSLIENGEYNYPYMGAGFVDELSLDDQEELGLSQTQGAYVLSVTDSGPAGRAGLIPADPDTGRGGDLIVAIDGRPIGDFADLNSYLVFETTVGQTIEITVLRGGEQVVVPLTLGARP